MLHLLRLQVPHDRRGGDYQARVRSIASATNVPAEATGTLFVDSHDFTLALSLCPHAEFHTANDALTIGSQCPPSLPTCLLLARNFWHSHKMLQ